MSDREDLIISFLKANGWAPSARRPLADDASFRRYERLREGQRTAVLMDAPSPIATTPEALIVARLFIGCGLATFVTCQVWCSQMFAKSIVGTVNATAAGCPRARCARWSLCGQVSVGSNSLIINGAAVQERRPNAATDNIVLG